MVFGAEIYGLHGRLQLADNVSNYYMVEKGTITDNAWGDYGFNRGDYGPVGPWWEPGEGGPARVRTLPTTLPYDFYALGGENINMAMYSSGGYGFGTPTAPKNQIATSGPVSGSRTLRWYTFRSYKHLTPANTGFGMEIINPVTGEVNFSLRYPKLLKTLIKHDFTTTPISLPTGKTLALIGFGSPYREVEYTGNPETGVMSFYSVLTATINSSNQLLMSRETDWTGLSPTSGVSINRTDGGVIVIDVTNY